ncbi:unnamed protein product [Arctogadus glacialis]
MLYLNENIMIVNCEQEMCLECQRCRVQHRKRAQTPFHKPITPLHPRGALLVRLLEIPRSLQIHESSARTHLQKVERCGPLAH